MQSKTYRGLILFGLVFLSTGSLTGCQEIQQVAKTPLDALVTNGWRKRSEAAGISSVDFFLLAMRRNKSLDKRLPYR